MLLHLVFQWKKHLCDCREGKKVLGTLMSRITNASLCLRASASLHYSSHWVKEVGMLSYLSFHRPAPAPALFGSAAHACIQFGVALGKA